MTPTLCPSGRTWDGFVLGLPTVDTAALAAHLEFCQDCRVIVADRREYYADLARFAVGSSTDATQRTLPVPVTLTVMNLIEIPARAETVMAAAGPAESPIPTASTFASDDRRWMVKVVWDSATGHEKLYVLSNDHLPVSGLLVRLSGLDGGYLTDARGSADLGPVRWPVSKNPQVTVISPAATFTLSAALLSEREETSTLIRSAADDILKVSLTKTETTRRLRLELVSLAPDLAGKTLRVAVRSVGGGHVLKLEPVMILDQFELPGTLEIFLFP